MPSNALPRFPCPCTRYIKVLQALKMLRVFKVSRHFAGTKILISTFEQSMRALRAPFVFLFVSVTIFASLMYFLESGQWNKEAQAYLEEGGESPTFSSVLDAAYVVLHVRVSEPRLTWPLGSCLGLAHLQVLRVCDDDHRWLR